MQCRGGQERALDLELEFKDGCKPSMLGLGTEPRSWARAVSAISLAPTMQSLHPEDLPP